MEKIGDFIDSNILISIIIATYNAEKDIADCLDSISQQKREEIEIVIVDGAGTDKTLPIINQYRFNNIVVISEPDKGIYDALNKGIQAAHGKWFYFLGSDDRLLPGFGDMLARLSDKNTVYYGNCEPFYKGVDPGYTILTGPFSLYRLCKVCINHQSIIYPATVFAKYSYDLRYKVFADWALNIKVWGDGNFKKQYFPITIARYNLEGFSSLHTDEAFEKDKPALIKKYMGGFLYLRFLFKQFKLRRKSAGN